MNRSGWICLFVAGTLVFGIPTICHATLVSGWGAETGFANGTVTDDTGTLGAGNFHTTTPTGNLAPRALLPGTLSLTNVGDKIVLSGRVAMAGAINGNQSFRFGLYNSNGNNTGTLGVGVWTGATPTGWLGYMAEIANLSNASGNNIRVRRNNPNTGNWFSGTGATTIQSDASALLNAAATYNFNLTLTRAGATSINVAYSFADTGSIISLSNSFLDSTVSTTSYNAVGFLQNTSSGGAATFANVDVTFTAAVPEVSAFACCAIAAVIGRMLTTRRLRV